jgi:hypothetical protein
LFGHLWVVELTYIYIFAFKFTLRSLQPDIVSTVGKFATGVVDTGGKFTDGVVDTGGNLPPVALILLVHLDLRISPQIIEKFQTVLMGNSGAGGKLIHEKNQKQKIS